MQQKVTNFSIFVSVIAGIGGFLFGFNASIISGALLFLKNDFHMSTVEEELVVSTLLIGALIGAFLGGILADRFGRRNSLFFAVILFLLGTLCLTFAANVTMLLAGRWISGLAIGLASLAVPLYIAEMSPPSRRGALVSINQLMITIGILIAYLISYLYSESDDWRAMFRFGLYPAIFQFLALFFIPETPSWLMSQNRKNAVQKVLRQIWPNASKEQLASHSKHTDTHGKKGWKELFKPAFRKPFFVGVGVSVLQQITGINTVIYYAPQIFQMSGYQTEQTAIFATLLVGIVNVVMTVLALWLIDLLGRRPLLMGGLIGMGAALAILGASFIEGSQHIGLTAIVGLMIYVAFFAISLGPVAWLIISEIYPLGVRGRAMGIATFANWVCNYFVSLTFLSLLDTFGAGYTFWLYTVICILGLYFVYKFVPETKGKTLEQIQKFWTA